MKMKHRRWNALRYIMCICIGLVFICGTSEEVRSAVKASEDDNFWVLHSEGYEVKISKLTGGLSRIRLLKPQPLDLFSEGERSMWISLTLLDHEPEWKAFIDRLVKGTVKKTGDSVTVDCELTSSEVRLARLVKTTASYRLYDDRLDVYVSFSFNWGMGEQCQMQVGTPWNHGDWERISTSQTDDAPAQAKILARYQDALDDAISPKIDFQGGRLYYPRILATRPDRYLLWGFYDLGKFGVFAPNRDGLSPCFLRTPIMVKPGETFTFDYFLSNFPRPEATPTDVETWYLRHMFSSEPLSAGLVTMSDDWPHRTSGYGNLRSHEPRNPDLKGWRPFIDYCKKTRQFCIWWYNGEKRWDDTYPLGNEKPWTCEQGARKGYIYTSQIMQKVIQGVQKEGFRPFIYFRQFFFLGNTAHETEGAPPYAEWALPDRDGGWFTYVHDYWKEYKWSADETKWYGITETNPDKWIPNADFCHPDFRDWYIKNLKSVIEFYKPAGIAFDMNWDTGGPVCARHPETHGIHHGELRVFAEVYKWIKEKHPDMKVIMNAGIPTPALLYCDAAMSEGWGKNTPVFLQWFRAQMLRAYRVNLLNLNYDGDVEANMRLLAMGFSWADNGISVRLAAKRTDDDPEIGYKPEPDEEVLPIVRLVWGVFSEFSAQTMATPLVGESHAVKWQPEVPLMYASAWANKERLLIAAFNDDKREHDVNIELNQNVLTDYGQAGKERLQFIIIGPDGRAKSVIFEQTTPFKINGSLPSKHLLLAYSGESITMP